MGVEEEDVVEEEGELVLSPEDTQMVASLTERLVRSIRVEQSVVRSNKGIGDAGSTADFRILWSAMVCLGLL